MKENVEKNNQQDIDLQMRQGIDTLLNDHPKLDASQIHVEVNNAKVLLKGKVDTDEEKQLAESLARSFEGVREVENALHTGLGITHALIETISRLTADDDAKENKGDKQ
jgi:osmotically-inducible protein OsmY